MSYESEVLADSPTAWYRLEETSGDVASDNAGTNDGTVFGADLTGTTGLSQLGSAATFDGVDDHIQIPTHVAMNPAAPFSVEFWMNAAGWGQNDLGRPVSSINSGETDGWDFYLNRNPGRISFNLGDGTGQDIITFEGISLDALYHIVGTHDGTDARLYINGSLGAGPTARGYSAQDSVASQIGRRAYDAARWFDGVVDEVAVYDQALSPTRISAHYDAAFASEDPANLAATVDGDTVSLSWDASPLVSA